MLITNAFSLNMLKSPDGANISVKSVSAEEVAGMDLFSAIGHADTATVVGGLLGKELKANRITVSVERGSVFTVAQYLGPRLPEGATVLPEGGRIEFFIVEIT